MKALRKTGALIAAALMMGLAAQEARAQAWTQTEPISRMTREERQAARQQRIERRATACTARQLRLGKSPSFSRLEKSTNYALMYTEGLRYYNTPKAGKDYTSMTNLRRAQALLSKAYRSQQFGGSPQEDSLYYFLGCSYYMAQDFGTSEQLFDGFRRQFGASPFVEDAEYKYAMGFYFQSPEPERDQTVTMQAMAAIMEYMGRYPQTSHREVCDERMAELERKLHTKSPMDYQGTDLRLGGSSHNRHYASLTHYHRISPTFAFSAGGFYDYTDGWQKNAFTGRQADRGQSGGGRIHAIWKPRPRLTTDMNVSYSYSDEQGYAYGAYDPATNTTAEVAYNNYGSYYRNLFNTNLTVEYKADKWLLSAVSNYEYLYDRMAMDQDFTPARLFTMTQKQRDNALSEEITIRSHRANRRWDWLFGGYGSYQAARTNAPVNFEADGVAGMLEAPINQYMPAMLNANFDIQNPIVGIPSAFKMPTYGLALYHQSTFNDLLLPKLALTLGLRLDYEHQKLQAISSSDFNYELPVSYRGQVLNLGNELNSAINADLSQSQTVLIPKASLTYKLTPTNSVYASFSKGYRSGGYNIQMMSDLMQTEVRADLTDQIRSKLADKMREAMSAVGAPEAAINAAIAAATGGIPTFERADVASTIAYKPEYTLAYEVGTHQLLILGGKVIQFDAALFYNDIHDQQIARFADSGLGRMMVNAGHSNSYGGEVSLSAWLTNRLRLNAAYGYTNATFSDYQSTTDVDYKGNYVPFSPKHTINAGVRFDLPCKSWSPFDAMHLGANYRGVGRIYWTEANDVSQPYYSLVDLELGATIGKAKLKLWVKNLTDTSYNTFCFNNSTSAVNYFAQRGRPFNIGADITLNF